MTTPYPAELDPTQYTILIVDDNPTNLGVLTDYLKEFGFTILNARDGEMGLKRAALTRPDIILLDVMMPGMDGFETCRRLKANSETQEIPVIFMTALTTTEDKVLGFEVGAVDYVTKPVQQAEVLARVTTHLRLRDLMRRLQQANAELAKMNAAKDKFFAILAHDLRGPFLPLLTQAEMVAEHYTTLEPETVQRMVGSIGASARHVYELLENLLEWSRLQMGLMDFQPGRYALSESVTRTIRVLEEQATCKGVTLEGSVDPKLFVHADEYMVDTILRNLISNALKFTLQGGQVTLFAQRLPEAPQWVEVTVTDTGIGVSPQDLAKLFRLGTHYSTVGTAQERGTGLGLLICQEMIQKQGGEVWADSEVGQGTTIRFTLPVA
ncbi:MAG: hybrid sensor histidine kinase/response regulator [Ardenticatenales bacterium]|nr:hybrid sensor histidine kinase/response regulator [Ardenticatenales bacterium]